jgi:hypothetical protein
LLLFTYTHCIENALGEPGRSLALLKLESNVRECLVHFTGILT